MIHFTLLLGYSRWRTYKNYRHIRLSKITLLVLIIGITLIGCKRERAKYYYKEAYKLEEKDKYSEAIKQLDKAIEINPKFEQAYLDRAIDKSILEDYKGAIADLDILINLRPDGIEPYLCRAEYNRMLGKYEDALKDTEKALELKKPLMVDSVMVGLPELNYANPYIKNGNYDIPLVYILYERGASNFHLGNYEEALKDLDYCIQSTLGFKRSKVPVNIAACRYYRGLTLLALGYLNEGCGDLKIASSLGDVEATKLLKSECFPRDK